MSGPGANGANGASGAAGANGAGGAAGAPGARPVTAAGRSGGAGFGGPGGRRPMGAGWGPAGGLMMPVQKPKNFRASLRRLVGELRPERSKVVFVILLSLLSVTGTIFGPKILGNALNKLIDGLVGKQLGQAGVPAGTPLSQVADTLRAHGQGQFADFVAGTHAIPGVGVDFGAVGSILLILAALYIASAVVGWMSWYTMAGVAQRTVYRLRRDVDTKLARLPLKYFDTHPRGDTLSRVTNDIDNISTTLQQALTQIITSITQIVGVLAIMYWISPLLATISVIVIPVAAVATMQIARRSQKQFAAQWQRTGTLNGHVEESHTGHAIVKVFGHQTDAIARFDEENEKVFEASFKAQFISGIIQPTMGFISNLNYVAIAVLGGVQVASGQLSLGDVQAFIQYSRSFTMPITQTASIMNVLQSTIASAERVFELLDEPEEQPDTETPHLIVDPVGHITLQNVSFRYEPETPLIEDLNVDVRSGETVAIVGPTGAGKTTLVNLLMRFYEIDSGRICVDGIDVCETTRENLRRTFGMVLQDAWLFGGTIRENIAYGRENATEAEIVAAAKAAHVDHFVRTLPHGYDTVIDDDASNLSQGEKQLLTIARAFLADPAILILDEATSSVDTRTEVLVQKAMASLMKGRTAFVIAHRLSTIRDADEILVMNHGRIVEQGTHEELLAKQGFYFELYNSQFVEALAEAV